MNMLNILYILYIGSVCSVVDCNLVMLQHHRISWRGNITWWQPSKRASSTSRGAFHHVGWHLFFFNKVRVRHSSNLGRW
jgi:hypothetical protein